MGTINLANRAANGVRVQSDRLGGTENLVGAANGGDWKIIAALNDKSGKIRYFQVPIFLFEVSTSPASDNAWSDPTATDGNGCNF